MVHSLLTDNNRNCYFCVLLNEKVFTVYLFRNEQNTSKLILYQHIFCTTAQSPVYFYYTYRPSNIPRLICICIYKLIIYCFSHWFYTRGKKWQQCAKQRNGDTAISLNPTAIGDGLLRPKYSCG